MDILDAARYVIHLSYRLKCYSLTPLKLQKILYYAQGWHYVWKGEPLFKESFEAWEYGPVNRRVYRCFKDYRGEEIPESEGNAMPSATNDELATLRAVWKFYGRETAASLVDMTHSEKPWQEAVEEKRDISNSDIKDYFLQHA